MSGMSSGQTIIDTQTKLCYKYSMENIKHTQIGTHALVLGDIHGNIKQFERAVEFAVTQNLSIISLGDLVDYGDQNLESIELLHTLMFDSGIAQMIIGNHDFKFNKWIDQSREGEVKVQVKGGMVNTVAEVVGNDSVDALDKFQRIYENSSFVLRAENTIFVHAAIHPRFWEGEFNSKLRSRALFGQVDGYIDNFPNRIYDWVDEMPDENTVYFGHDIMSYDTVTAIKGRAFAMDTGSSKSGRLTGAVVELQDGRYVPVQEVGFDK